jgi:hypothetical protein
MIGQLIRLADDREELRRNHDRFRALIENAADGITVLDRNGLILYEGPSSECAVRLVQTMLALNDQCISQRQVTM